jgi:signal transduction histidine kinase
MRARLTAAGLRHARLPSAPPPRDDGADIPLSARVSAARARARERVDRQRRMLRPLGWALIALVVIAGLNSHPAPGMAGTRLAVSLTLAGCVAAVAVTMAVARARRGYAFQAGLIGVLGGCGTALAALQPHGPGQIAASVAVWIATVRLPARSAIVATALITGALAATIALTLPSATESALAAALLCLLLAVTGWFIRRGWESQDHTELLMAQLQDAREAEAAAAALAERGRIAGELHDVLAHALSGLAIQLQGARKLADRELASDALQGALARSADLAREGLTDARQAVGALRGDRLPTVDQVGALIEDFRRDTGAAAELRIDGAPRPLPADASLALFRGAQEALTNITRYAPAASVTVTVRYERDRTVLAVEDHAASADPAGQAGPAQNPLLAEAGGGHGLAAMRERAARAGGTARAGPTTSGWLVELEVPG